MLSTRPYTETGDWELVPTLRAETAGSGSLVGRVTIRPIAGSVSGTGIVTGTLSVT